MANGASEEHGEAVADALLIGMRQGKLNQGLGVYEAIDLATRKACSTSRRRRDRRQGPTWAMIDGKKSPGYWTLTKMAHGDREGQGARHPIVFGANHNDGGSFGSTPGGLREDCLALTSNNSAPMCSPLGGMSNTISVPPWDGSRRAARSCRCG